MGLSVVLILLIVEGFVMWWMTKYSGFRLFLWLICCAAFWPTAFSQATRDTSFSYIVFGGAVWTIVPPLGWFLRRRTDDQ